MIFRVIPRHNINFCKREFLAIFSSIKNGQVIYGDKIQEFEAKFANYFGVRHAISVSSGRAALFLILKALNFDEADQIIIPSYSFFVIPEMIKTFRLVPVFAEIEPATYNISPFSIEEKITRKTKAIIVEHIFGQPCDMEQILRITKNYKLKLIEDCAQSCGSEYRGYRVGSLGDVGYFSFAKGKNLTCLGGGMIVTNYNHLADLVRRERDKLQSYSIKEIIKIILSGVVTYLCTLRFIYTLAIFPFFYLLNLIDRDLLIFDEKPRALSYEALIREVRPLSNIQAAIGVEQLKRLEELNKKRIDNTNASRARLNGIKDIILPAVLPGVKNIHSCFSIRIENAKVFSQRLFLKGIDSRADWMSSYSTDNFLKDLPKEILYLPNYSSLTKRDMFYIAESIRDILKSANKKTQE